MDDPQFNVIFNKEFDDDYKNIMNRVVDHINYYGYEGSGASIENGATGYDDDDDDSNNDDDDSDNESDEDDDIFFKETV